MKKLFSIVISILLSIHGFTQSICFDLAAENRYETGGYSQTLAKGDFNEDGHLDIVTANYLTTHGALLLGNGDGSFQPYVQLNFLSNNPEQIEVADFNNDTHADIIVYTRDNAGLSILYGNGDGTFQTASTFTLGILTSNPKAMAVAEFTGDNYPDVAVNDYSQNKIYILKNNGAGGFIHMDTLATLAGPNHLKAGKLNAGSSNDLVVSYYNTNDISTYLNSGNGTFGPATDMAAGGALSLMPLDIVDIDNDNDNDIVSGGIGAINIFLNNGAASFIMQPGVPIAGYCYEIVDGLFDNDGNADIGWVYSSGGFVGEVNGNGNGTFDMSHVYSVNGDPNDCVRGDFDEDGNQDVVSSNSGDRTITFMKGQGDGSFGLPDLRVGGDPISIVSADVNNDNAIDLVTANSNYINGNTVSVLMGNNDGTFQLATDYPCLGSPHDITGEDFDQNGFFDLAVVDNNGSMHIKLNDGTGAFPNTADYPMTNGGSDRNICVGLFNNDSYYDVAASEANTNQMFVFINNGNGTFQNGVAYNTGTYPEDVASGDLNGDNKVDLIVANDQSNDLSIYYGNGNGTFQTAVSLPYNGTGARGVAITDLNDDGHLDIATANNNSVDVSVILGHGNGTYDAPVNYPLDASSSPGAINHGLINSDTLVDLLVTYPITNRAVVLFGLGAGTFGNIASYDVDDNPNDITVADYNNDGALDIATPNGSVNNVSVILNNSAYINASGPTNFCSGDSVTLVAQSTNGFTYLWSTGATTQSIVVNSTGTYSVSITNQAGDCTIVPAVIGVNVFDVVQASINFLVPDEMCIHDAPIALQGGSPQGGDYSGNGVSNGVINPQTAGSGVDVITYSYTDAGGCATTSDTAWLTIYADPNAQIQIPSDSVCSAAAPFIITTSYPGGTMYIDGNTDSTFDASSLGVGTHIITYYSSNGLCVDTATETITVVNAITASLNIPVTQFCDTLTTVTLTGGSPSGGSYSGTDVSNGVFHPSQAGVGTYDITYVYSVSGCADTVTQSIAVIACPTGIEDVNANSFVTVYPNVTSSNLNVMINGASEKVNAQLVDVNGQLLMSWNLSSGNHALDIHNLAAGMYFLRVRNADQMQVVKIVKE